MTKLKTLKDLEEGKYMFKGLVQLRHVREEAIKHIKAIQSMEKTPQDKLWEEITGKTIVYSEKAKQGIINYIKWANNISEEDLK